MSGNFENYTVCQYDNHFEGQKINGYIGHMYSFLIGIVVNIIKKLHPSLLTTHATQAHSLCLCICVHMHMYNVQVTYSCCLSYSPSEWLCYTDAEKEGRLVPIIVGAIIGFLMVVIFFAYMAAFSKRKCAERRSHKTYVALGNDMW